MTTAYDFGPAGFCYPAPKFSSGGLEISTTTLSNTGAIDAASESIHIYGSVYIDGRPGSSKTISSSGGKIHLLIGALTWANAGTTLRVGIQDMDNTTDDPPRGDGTFDVFDDLVPGTDTVSANTWLTVTMSSGSKSITPGDEVAIVLNLEALGGADSITVRGATETGAPNFPNITVEAPANSYTGQIVYPNVVIEFDDGTLGFIFGGWICTTFNSHTFDSASTPDEYANIIQFSRPTPVDGYWWHGRMPGSAGSFEMLLYSDPEGTPAVVSGSTITEDIERQLSAQNRSFYRQLPAPILLSANTKYAVAWRPVDTGGDLTMASYDVADASHLKGAVGGTQCYFGTRSNQSGAFSTTTTRRLLGGVVACGGDDGAGGGLTVGGTPMLRGMV